MKRIGRFWGPTWERSAFIETAVAHHVEWESCDRWGTSSKDPSLYNKDQVILLSNTEGCWKVSITFV